MNILSVNYEYLKVFHMVARCGSVTKAASSLHITQPAVSSTIAKLEERIKCRLFARSGRRIVLTEAGSELFKATSAMHRELLSGQQALERLQTLESGHLLIAVPQLLMHHLVLPVLTEFHAMHPDIVIEPVISNRESELIEMVEQGRADIMMVTTPDRSVYSPELAVTAAGTFRYGFKASRKAFAELEGEKVSIGRLARYPLACLTPGHVARTSMQALFESQGAECRVRFECENMALVEDYVRSGLAVGMVIRGCLEQLEGEQDIFAVRIAQKLPSGELVLATSRRRPISSAAGEFHEAMLAYCRRRTV